MIWKRVIRTYVNQSINLVIVCNKTRYLSFCHTQSLGLGGGSSVFFLHINQAVQQRAS